MRHILVAALCLLNFSLFAQKPCEYATNVTDSLGTYKLTKEYLVSEKVFAGNSSYIFYSLALTDGIPTLTVQLIQKKQRVHEGKLL